MDVIDMRTAAFKAQLKAIETPYRSWEAIWSAIERQLECLQSEPNDAVAARILALFRVAYILHGRHRSMCVREFIYFRRISYSMHDHPEFWRVEGDGLWWMPEASLPKMIEALKSFEL